jgi:hypothetical protein
MRTAKIKYLALLDKHNNREVKWQDLLQRDLDPEDHARHPLFHRALGGLAVGAVADRRSPARGEPGTGRYWLPAVPQFQAVSAFRQLAVAVEGGVFDEGVIRVVDDARVELVREVLDEAGHLPAIAVVLQ